MTCYRKQLLLKIKLYLALIHSYKMISIKNFLRIVRKSMIASFRKRELLKWVLGRCLEIRKAKRTMINQTDHSSQTTNMWALTIRFQTKGSTSSILQGTRPIKPVKWSQTPSITSSTTILKQKASTSLYKPNSSKGTSQESVALTLQTLGNQFSKTTLC